MLAQLPVLSLVGLAVAATPSPPAPAPPSLPVSFIENRGQAAPDVAYYAHTGRTSVFFTRTGVTVVARGGQSKPRTVEQAFLGAGAVARPHASRRRPGVVSYFSGPRSQWQTGLRTYGRLVYRSVWPGIDVVYSAGAKGLRRRFVVRPGGNPRTIKLAYRGAGARQRTLGAPELGYAGYIGGSGNDAGFATAIDGAGNTYLTGWTMSADFPATPGGPDRFGGNQDAFVAKVGPAGNLVYSSYIGGDGDDDQGRGIAVDGSGNAYVAGVTNSSQKSFPQVRGPDLTYNGANDTFVAKLNPTGTRLLYLGYIGGNRGDGGRGIAVDAAGNAYVSGVSESRAATFPVKVGPDLTFNGEPRDGFIAKVNPAGTGLIYCGYIGGDREDAARGPAVDAAGNVYVTGYTYSSEATFPVSVGPDLTHNGGEDSFVAKVHPSGSRLRYAGYIGGAGNELGHDIAVDVAGNPYVVGHTQSNEATFPVAVGPDLTYNGGELDGFVAKIKTHGEGFVYSGYVGGAGKDQGRGIALDGTRHAYIAGDTTSRAGFPALGGPDLSYNGGPADAFIAKLTSAGTGLDFAGYIGGTGSDFARGIRVDAGGSAYVVGITDSSEASFPATTGPDSVFNGGTDAFLAKLATP